MNLSTFRTFLCKEAQLCLSILGPGWSNAVKEESQWRLEMYRKFLERVRDDDKTERRSKSSGRRQTRGRERRARRRRMRSELIAYMYLRDLNRNKKP